MKADALPTDLERIAVDDAGMADDVGLYRDGYQDQEGGRGKKSSEMEGYNFSAAHVSLLPA